MTGAPIAAGVTVSVTAYGTTTPVVTTSTIMGTSGAASITLASPGQYTALLSGTGAPAYGYNFLLRPTGEVDSVIDSLALAPAHSLNQIGWISVKDTTFGAVGDDSHDDTAAFNSAIALANNATLFPHGAVIWLPPGNYKITSGLVALSSSVGFAGCGRKTSTISFVPTVANQTLVTLGGSNGNSFRDIYFGCGSTYQTTATCFMLNATLDVAINNCDISGFACAWYCLDVNVMLAAGIGISQCAGSQLDSVVLDGTVQKQIGSGTVISGCTEMHFTDVGNGTTGTSAVAGWHLKACDGVWLSNCDTIDFNYALQCDPSTAISGVRKTVGESFFTACDFDASATNSVILQPGEQGSVVALQFIGGRHGSLSSNSCLINTTDATAQVGTIQFLGTGFEDALSGYGLAILNYSSGSVQDISVIGCTITANKLGGIIVDPNVDGVTILANKFRPVSVFYASPQNYAVVLNSASNVTIADNDVRGQATAPFEILNSTDGTLRIRNNIGDAYVPTFSLPMSGVPYLNATGRNNTYYVTGGTVTVIAVNGTTTHLLTGAFSVSAGSSIAISYSVAPTVTVSTAT